MAPRTSPHDHRCRDLADRSLPTPGHVSLQVVVTVEDRPTLAGFSLRMLISTVASGV
jgi:hypothetical protein